MADWRPAPSVAAILAEATQRWPDRNKGSDGIIGDAAHSSRRSDHNPDERGIVHAADLTHDPAHGVDCHRLSEWLRTNRDRRIRYVIWNGRLFRGPWSDAVLLGDARAWAWERYTGVNPHRSHMHVSIGYNRAVENNVAAWFAIEGEEEMPDLEEIKAVRDDGVKMITVGEFGEDVNSERDVYNLRAITLRLMSIETKVSALSSPEIDYTKLAQALSAELNVRFVPETND